MDDLTPKQEKFAQHVASGIEYAEAYRMSYNCERMKNDAIYVEASKLANNPKITLRVEEIRRQDEERVRDHLKLCTGTLVDIIDFDPATLYENGDDNRQKLRPPSHWTRKARKALTEHSIGVRGIKVKWSDKVKAIDSLARLEGLNKPEQHELKLGNDGKYRLNFHFGEGD